ncbi:VOC family protein [Planomonospora sp. ID67723]|uniref:methyltransferase n=1 Tax=Planomonospora sp. ID67723 TaxID=2738134 RepID=UPI0018C3AA28|nr:methyltransferase [Planomonospora sp. ID67723]MBG0832784.1 VOC family protein [Planomonospora sp. ID67723]
MGTVHPLARYRDPGAAIDWLAEAFGFEVHEVSKGDDGAVKHAELLVGTGVVMLGPGEPGGPGVYVAVDDPDAHHDRAVAAGARITMKLTDQSYGSREYACEDIEGNIWYFGTYQPTTAPKGSPWELISSYMPAQILYVAAELDLAAHLAGGERETAELAAATGTHAPSLRRLLRALACLGLVTETVPGRFTLTEAGDLLKDGSPGSFRAMARLICGPDLWASWGLLIDSVRTGEPTWERVTGFPAFEWTARDPEGSAIFNRAMSENTRRVAPGIIAGFDFARFGTLVDVGGGDGTLLSAILRAVPDLRGVLFDLPSGLAEAERNLAGLRDRCETVSGDFFEAVPQGADAYLLKSVIHDWDDERATAILRACHAAMGPQATLLVLEPVLPERIDSPAATGIVMSDINMLVATGGRERTEAEFRALLTGAGFGSVTVTGPFPETELRMISARP